MKKATLLALALLLAPSAFALSIYDIQYSTPPDYESPYLGETVDVSGGVVTKIWIGYRTKVTIQDPTLGDAWAGVQIVFDDESQIGDLARGDRIDIFGVVVDESHGNTLLMYEETSSFVINATGYEIDPLIVPITEIPYPVDHDLSEKYEFMLLQVIGVHVGAMDLGSHEDNYELVNDDGVCWAADYVCADLPPGSDYYVDPDDCFASVTGYLEQYVNDEYDYYQLLPRDAQDYVEGATPAQETTWGGVKALFK